MTQIKEQSFLTQVLKQEDMRQLSKRFPATEQFVAMSSPDDIVTNSPWWEKLANDNTALDLLSNALEIPVVSLLDKQGDREKINNLFETYNTIDISRATQAVAEAKKQAAGLSIDEGVSARYDAKAKFNTYDSFISGFNRPEQVAGFFDLPSESLSTTAVLDLGSNKGRFLKEGFPYPQGRGIRIGVDISPQSIEQGKKEGNFDSNGSFGLVDNVSRITGVVGGPVDLVTANFVLDTAGNPKDVLREASRFSTDMVEVSVPLPFRNAPAIGTGKDPFRDLEILLEEGRKVGLKPVKIGISTFYGMDVGGIDMWPAFIVMFKK